MGYYSRERPFGLRLCLLATPFSCLPSALCCCRPLHPARIIVCTSGPAPCVCWPRAAPDRRRWPSMVPIINNQPIASRREGEGEGLHRRGSTAICLCLLKARLTHHWVQPSVHTLPSRPPRLCRAVQKAPPCQLPTPAPAPSAGSGEASLGRGDSHSTHWAASRAPLRKII